MESTQADRDLIKSLDGLYAVQLDDDERESLNRCIKDRLAIRDYDHVGGFLGVAKVKVINL